MTAMRMSAIPTAPRTPAVKSKLGPDLARGGLPEVTEEVDCWVVEGGIVEELEGDDDVDTVVV
jgi:hypothetical protein